MSQLSGEGITVDVPDGWEGRIFARREDDVTGLSNAGSPPPLNAIVHLASFPLPPGTADYGGGAVEVMTTRDLLVILMEHGQRSATTALFAQVGIPRITIDDVKTTQLQRLIDGQGGAQKFFNVNGRAFCLYVVFGSHMQRGRTLPIVNSILDSLAIA